MRIAYLSTFYPFRGGIAQFNALLLKELQKIGHQVDAWTFTTQYPDFLFPGDTQYVKDDDLDIEKIDSRRILSTINPFSWQIATKKIMATHPDLLIMKFWMPFFAPSLGYVAGKLKKNARVITIIDNVIPHEKMFLYAALSRYFLKKNHGFIVMSEKVKTDLLSMLPNAHVELIPHPLYNHFGDKMDKTAARLQLGIDPHKRTLLFFGFIRDYKGLDLLIQSFGALDDSYQLVIAGETYGDFEKYNNLINSNPNKAHLHKYIKYISDKEVSLYFSAADVCVLPYKSATQSGITGISYHFELPLIATNVGGLSETIQHEKTGLIVEKPTVDDLTNGIRNFFEKYDRNKFSENIRQIKNELTWENFAKKLLNFATNLP